MKIGVCLGSMGLPIRRGLEEARRAGAGGVQLDAVGDLAPKALSQTGRRELRHLVRSRELEVCAVGCPLRRGLDSPENQEARIEHVKNVMTLAYDLEAHVVVVQAGPVPAENQDSLMTETLRALSAHGDRVGVALALETGLESGEVLAKYLARFDTGSLGVNFDPANLLMHGLDPYESVRALHGRILQVHAKDARRASASRAAQEVPLGHGDLDWLQLVGIWEEIEYRGWITVERESGDNRLADVQAGVAFLRRLLPGRP